MNEVIHGYIPCNTNHWSKEYCIKSLHIYLLTTSQFFFYICYILLTVYLFPKVVCSDVVSSHSPLCDVVVLINSLDSADVSSFMLNTLQQFFSYLA